MPKRHKKKIPQSKKMRRAPVALTPAVEKVAKEPTVVPRSTPSVKAVSLQIPDTISELKRIGILAGIIIVILLVLYFVL